MTDTARSEPDGPAQVPTTFDVVIVGTGSGGKPLAGELARAGRSVLAIEAELVGGECPYVACIPSKALLLAARRHRARTGPAGSSDPDPVAYADAVAVRDRISRYRDDSAETAILEKDGVTLLRGTATVDGRRVRVESPAGRREVGWRQALVLATGSAPVVPPIEGLATAPVWTSAEALSGDELPARLTILGGGPIGCELAQVYASFGSAVTLIEASPSLLPAESDWIGAAMADVLRAVGVDVRTSTEVTAVETDPDRPEGAESGRDPAALVCTGEGDRMAADRILVAVGRRPRTEGLGLDSLGATARDDGALEIDGRCRVVVPGGALDDVFAIGDLTAIAPYTHTANYHARLVAAHLLGHGEDADHTGIPRVVYTDPPVLCAGETEAAARERGVQVLTARNDATQTSRSAVERAVDPDDHRPAGLELIADADSGALLGVAAIGPDADSWAAGPAMAVRVGLTVHEVAGQPQAFPSWGEAIHPPARSLADRIGVRPKPATANGGLDREP